MPADRDADAAFRAEARAWLAAHAEPRTGEGDWSTGPRDGGPEAERAWFERCRAWQRTRCDGGWAGITWPVEHGGRGGTAWQSVMFEQEQARFDVTSGFLASTIGMVGPLLLRHGSDAQRRRYLRPLLRGDEAWCQLFSEPGAGSDLASLSTRAVRDGDELVVSGQKVWTSNAHLCDRAILLVRTDPAAPKHRGISLLLVDMRAPGIDVRPLRQITGTAHFNEVFLTDVRVPVADVVGEVDGGWGPARTVLASEAMVIGTAGGADGVEAVAALAGAAPGPVARQDLAAVATDERLLRYAQDRVLASVRDDRPPAIDGSVLKVAWSQARRRRGEVAVGLLGASGTLWGDDAPRQGHWQVQFLNRFWASIGGGTDEVHRTMIGERVLGLPREPK